MKTKNTCTDFKNSKLGQGEDDVGRGKGGTETEAPVCYSVLFLGEKNLT